MAKETVLVIGASGTVGSTLIQLLKEQGSQVRAATSRVPQSSEHVHINLVTGEGREAAFNGVDKAFFLSPPGYTNQDQLLKPLIAQAKTSGLKKVLLMTAMGANANPEAPMRKAEVALETSGVPYNIIRPNWFMQNFNTFWVHDILAKSQIRLPAGDAKVSFIDARDIAATAARLLATDTFANKDFDLSGPDAITHAQVASALSQASGRTISYQDIPPAELKASLLKAGLPNDYADFMLLIFGFLKEGYSAGITPHVKAITGKAPRSIADYARDFKSTWA